MSPNVSRPVSQTVDPLSTALSPAKFLSPFSTTSPYSSVVIPDSSVLFKTGLDTFKSWFIQDHPLKYLDPPPTELEENNVDFFFPLLKGEFLSGNYRPDLSKALDLAMLSSQVTNYNEVLTESPTWKYEKRKRTKKEMENKERKKEAKKRICNKLFI